MVVGNVRRERTVLGARLAILIAGVAVMIVPFAYMLATSFKHNQLVLQLPPQFICWQQLTSDIPVALKHSWQIKF